MTKVILKITGMEKVENIFRNLPKELQKEINKTSGRFLEDVRKSAKLRAPRFTGFLASSIFVDKTGKNIQMLSVTAPYAVQMETGKGLPHYAPISELSPWFGASRTTGAKFVARSLPPRAGMVVVRHFKPFVQPALEHNLAKLQTKLSDATQKAIARSRR